MQTVFCPTWCRPRHAMGCATWVLPSPAWRRFSFTSPGGICVNSQTPSTSHNLGAGVSLKAFFGLFLRDTRVLTREMLPFLLRVGMQPLLFLFVFTFILPRMGGGNPMATAGGV